jgi:hypothetical protein
MNHPSSSAGKNEPISSSRWWTGLVLLLLGCPILIPLAVAAVAPRLAPYSATFPGKHSLAKDGDTIPQTAQAFAPFQQRLGLSWDDKFLYAESNGLPDHPMMVGITAWQQQVPLPHGYVGENAWRIPLDPKPAEKPAMIKGRFLRGAIALGVNGIPIFNPQNNRGEISQEIGELDQWGGHCGRGDDYHYHIAPLHLEEALGKGAALAYALDGFPILGLTEADGSAPRNLDSLHGHEHGETGYHYHASNEYPYVMGGFYGEVVEAGGQVDPQPRAGGIRPALRPLRGAEITGFEGDLANGFKLTYEIDGKEGWVDYRTRESGGVDFTFTDPDGTVRKETHEPRAGGKGGERPPKPGNQKGKGGKGGEKRPR